METIIYVTSIKIKKSIIYMTLQSDQKLDPLSIATGLQKQNESSCGSYGFLHISY